MAAAWSLAVSAVAGVVRAQMANVAGTPSPPVPASSHPTLHVQAVVEDG
jgi:hypothetical protein